MKAQKLVKLVALVVVVSMPLLGMAGVASAKNVVGSAKWCAHHKKLAVSTPGCPSYVPAGGTTGSGGGSGGSDPSLTIVPNPLVETGQGEVHAVLEFSDPTAAGQEITIESPSLTAACGGTITFSDLQGVASGTTITPVTSVNQVTLTLDSAGNADAVVSGVDCAPGSDIFDASLTLAPLTTETAILMVDPPVVTTAGITADPGTEVETGDTPASGDSDVYAVFYLEGDPVYAEQQAEISDVQLESSCQGGWIWEPGNTTLVGGKNSGNISGNPHNAGPTPPANTAGDEPYTTIDDDGNTVFTFMGISCAASSLETPPGSTVLGNIAFNLPGNHPSYMGTFIVAPLG